MKVGVTASSHKITVEQEDALRKLLGEINEKNPIMEAHHGDCIVGDALFDRVVRELFPKVPMHIHPCDIDDKRAYCKVRPGLDVLYPVKKPLVRNIDIIKGVDKMIGMPYNNGPWSQRGGTWYTIRHAKGARDLFVIFPAGNIDPYECIDF